MDIFESLCIADEEEVQDFIQLVAKNIKRIRLQKGITQLELALMIGQKSSAFYANAENNKNNRRFNLEHIYKIAKVLDVDVVEFFQKESENNS